MKLIMQFSRTSCHFISFDLQLGGIYIATTLLGRAIAQEVSHQLPTSAVRVPARSVHVGFVVGKVARGQIFSEYFDFPWQLSFHRLLYNHQYLSSGAGIIGQTVAAVLSGFSLTPLHESKKKKKKLCLRD
jgi:hypothetical protein